MRPLSTVLFVCAALAARAALGQSLSIVKEGTSNYWVEAIAPANNPYALQASGNLHLWVNIQDEVQGQYSNRFGGSGVLQRYFRLTPSTPPAPPIRVMLIGDSMTSDCCGWGQAIYGYFKPNATVINYALPWTSTKVFLRSAELDKMLVVKPDYVLMQYGYMDQASGADLVDSYTTPAEYADNLRTIVKMVRGFNGVPILVTLHSARVWDANGKVIPTWQDRNAVTKQVASELQTPLIDLNQLTFDLFSELGPSCQQWMRIPGFPPDDVMHLSLAGAQFVARLVVNALPDSFGPYLTGILDQPSIPSTP
jgi:lysophospholipase L1-like esterase